jgi:hypothetical protein
LGIGAYLKEVAVFCRSYGGINFIGVVIVYVWKLTKFDLV